MIISRTPYRISFFGGGTDYPDWYLKNGGKVLSTTFDKYCYISLRNLPQFFSHKYRIVYSQIESINSYNEIKHPSVREILRYFDLPNGLEIHHDGDLPARSGLGSSSSFTVGLLNAIYAFQGLRISNYELACLAINMEQNIIKEPVGSQDQIAAAYGGFNKINFQKDGDFSVNRQIYDQNRISDLNKNLMLFFSGQSRYSSDVSSKKIENIKEGKNIGYLSEIESMVDESISILGNKNKPLNSFGELLNEAWKCKKQFTGAVSNSLIDSIYKRAIEAGALGGKLLGAGGGGFIIFYVETHNQNKVKEMLRDLMHVPFKFDNKGSDIVLYQPEGFE